MIDPLVPRSSAYTISSTETTFSTNVVNVATKAGPDSGRDIVRGKGRIAHSVVFVHQRHDETYFRARQCAPPDIDSRFPFDRLPFAWSASKLATN